MSIGEGAEDAVGVAFVGGRFGFFPEEMVHIIEAGEVAEEAVSASPEVWP